jgi:hypothetical protein
MKTANEKKLCGDFPRLYRGATLSVQESCMAWGFSCADGWFDLTYKLSEAIEAKARELGIDPLSEAWPRARQVKEKFGTLRFYVSAGENDEPDMAAEQVGGMISFRPVAGIDAIQDLVRNAEKASARICEICGKAGVLHRDGYWRVRCDYCEENKEAIAAASWKEFEEERAAKKETDKKD